MNKTVALVIGAAATFGCASLTPEGKQVKVYQADVMAADQPAPPLPDGCRLLRTWGPIDQQQEAREIGDPYLKERNQTAAVGGNILYLRSYRFKDLMKTDCPVGDKSQGCMDQSQSWYKVTFMSYGCNAEALADLATAPVPSNPAIFRWELKKKTPEATAAVRSAPTPTPAVAPAPAPARAAVATTGIAELKVKILALQKEGVGTDVIVSFVRANRPAAPLSADEIIDWKKAGIPDEVIRATFPN
jgi:hypothetical protein